MLKEKSCQMASPFLRPRQGDSCGNSEFKIYGVGVLYLFLFFNVTVRKILFCHAFILFPVTTFWAMLLVEIYPDRASFLHVEWNNHANTCNPVMGIGYLRSVKLIKKLTVIWTTAMPLSTQVYKWVPVILMISLPCFPWKREIKIHLVTPF